MPPAGRLALMLAVALLMPGRAAAWQSVDPYLIFGTNTHETQFDSGYSLATSTKGVYRDIELFQSVLRHGCDNESAHYGPGAMMGTTRPYWYKNEAEWRTEALREYCQLDFSAAYRHVGFVLHLVQDFEERSCQLSRCNFAWDVLILQAIAT